MRPHALAALLVVAAAAGGCRSVPTQACIDQNQAFANDYVRCDGADYMSTYNALVESSTMGYGCGNAHSLRDKESFYAQCIPWIEGLTCAQLHDPSTPVDPSCMDQITIIHYVH